MKNIDLKYICTVIGNLSGIPIRLFEGQKRIYYHSIVSLPKDPMLIYQDEIWNLTENVTYFVTQYFNYYGIVNSGTMKIIIGPTCQVTNSTQELKEMAFQTDIAAEDVDDFVNGMKSIVAMPLESVMQMLCTINYILNDEKLELKDIAIHDTEQTQLKALLEKQQASLAFIPDAAEKLVVQAVHNTFKLEETLMNIVRKGDTAVMRDWIASAPAVRGGILASDQLRQLKNTFIVTATLVSRAAIRGGLDTEEAFSLSDAFIQQCELLHSPERITNLQYQMVMEFTERVERIRLGKRHSKLAMEVANYIQHHMSDPISAEDLAKHLFISRPYLSLKFKEETGETLTDFILKEKTEEAKRLLRYTDKTATAIASYLGFSSHSHFTRVFKKYVGKTPAEYREKYIS